MELANLLADFGKSSGMGSLTLDSQGLGRLVFDEQFAIDIHPLETPGTPSGFLLSASVGTLSADTEARILRRFLAANLFARGANDAFVGLNTASNDVVILCRHECAAMDAAAFDSALLAFLDQVQAWSEWFKQEGRDFVPLPDSGNDIPQFMLTEGFSRA